MRISSISDVHIYSDNDSRAQILQSFLNSENVQNSEIIVLLGDIFDMMVGNKKEYLNKYKQTFESIKAHCRNKKLIYISGNHDFSLNKILNDYFKDLDFQYSEKPIVLKDNGCCIYLSHGDEIDVSDKSYLRWKKIYSNKLFQSFVDKALPYKFIELLGQDASKSSKKRNIKSFDYEEAKSQYTKNLKSFKESNDYDFYILGHTHIKYLDVNAANNGFPLEHRSFVYYENKQIDLIPLR